MFAVRKVFERAPKLIKYGHHNIVVTSFVRNLGCCTTARARTFRQGAGVRYLFNTMGRTSKQKSGGRKKRVLVAPELRKRVQLNAPNDENLIAAASKSGIQVLATPIKSESDVKDYRIIVLPNGMRCILISDTTEFEEEDEPDHVPVFVRNDRESSKEQMQGFIHEIEKNPEDEDLNIVDDEEADMESLDATEKMAACGLCVSVGSFSDPRDCQGLAHFLEHMIFMGSEKYPKENTFDVFVKRNGGFLNADTDCEETNYYFEVDEDNFDGALDIFSHLLKKPLLSKEAMTREREAVDSEYRAKMFMPGVRRDQLIAKMGWENHPCSIFTWGNKETLQEKIDDDTLHKKVTEFRERHYSAHRMYLALQARKSLDELQELAMRHFADVPSNNLPGDDFSTIKTENDKPFKEEFYENVIFIKPVRKACNMEFRWCMPSLLNDYKSKSNSFLSYLLGHEGHGSLSSYLRKHLWSLTLSAGINFAGFEHNTMYSLFTIELSLTEEGFRNIDDVIAAIFGYLKFLQVELKEEHSYIYDDLSAMEKIRFRYKREVDALDNVEDLCLALKYYDPVDILTGSDIYYGYDYDDIHQLLDMLNSGEFNLEISCMYPFEGVKYELEEKWFKTEYSSIPFPAKWREIIANAEPLPEFKLPEKNPFIPDDFSIYVKKPECPTVILEYPDRVHLTPVAELWYRPDDKFLLPFGYMYFALQSPLPIKTAHHVLLNQLYSSLLSFALIEDLYPAILAEAGYSIYTIDTGIVIRTFGYNQHLSKLVKVIIEKMVKFANEVTETEFDTMLDNFKRQLYNNLLNSTYVARELRLCIVETNYVSILERNIAVDTLELNDFKTYAKQYLRQLKIVGLIQGNISKEEAIDTMKLIVETIRPMPIRNLASLVSRARQLPKGETYIRIKSNNPQDENSLIVNVYQVGPIGVRLGCLLDLLMMIAEEPLFDILRTKEQLGYDVNCSVRENNGILSYRIAVHSQETKHDSVVVEQRIEVFRRILGKIILLMPQNDFDSLKDTLISIKQTADLEILDEVQRNWMEIISGDFVFDRAMREIECIRELTKIELYNFYVSTLKKPRKLSTNIVGYKEPEKSVEQHYINELKYDLRSIRDATYNPNRIDDLDKFVKGLYVYPIIISDLNFHEKLNVPNVALEHAKAAGISLDPKSGSPDEHEEQSSSSNEDENEGEDERDTESKVRSITSLTDDEFINLKYRIDTTSDTDQQLEYTRSDHESSEDELPVLSAKRIKKDPK